MSMQTRAFVKIIKQHLLGEFPGFVLTKTGDMLQIPMNHLWRGFVFAGSAYCKTSFRVNVVILPLYVPAEHLDGLFSKRLQFGNTDTLEWDESNAAELITKVKQEMRSEGLDYLNRVKSPLDFGRVQWNRTDNKSLESVAYSLIYAREFARALPIMESICRELSQIKTDVPWTIDWIRQVVAQGELLKRSPEVARAQLLEWEKQNIVNLKLEAYTN